MNFSLLLVVAVSMAGCAMARPQHIVAPQPITFPVLGERDPRIVPVLSRQEIRDDAGQYSLAFRSGDGAAQSSYGVLRANPDGRGHFLAVTGSYSYTSPDGTPIYVNYVADENGFRILGNHVPEPVTPVPLLPL